MSVAWVSLDADDNQPLRFWSTIIAALQTIYPNLGQDLPTPLRILSSADLNEIVIGLTNAIVRASDALDAPVSGGQVARRMQRLYMSGVIRLSQRHEMFNYKLVMSSSMPNGNLMISMSARPASLRAFCSGIWLRSTRCSSCVTIAGKSSG
jgi:hypothetical protein